MDFMYLNMYICTSWLYNPTLPVKKSKNLKYGILTQGVSELLLAQCSVHVRIGVGETSFENCDSTKMRFNIEFGIFFMVIQTPSYL